MPLPEDKANFIDGSAYERDNLAWIGSKLDTSVSVDHSRPGDVGAGAWTWVAENMFHDINNTPGLDEADMMYRMLVQAQHDYFGSDSHQGVLINPGRVYRETDPDR